MKRFKLLITLFFVVLFSVCANSHAGVIDNVRFGMPSTSGTILTRTGYVLSYNKVTKDSDWVSYELTAEELKTPQLKRSNKFAPDPDLPVGERAELADYRGSGYDRGHMCPNADQAWSAVTMKECFYLSNMCPQLHGLNAGVWENLEKAVRTFTKRVGASWIVCGPVFKGDKPSSIGLNRVAVPSGFYKVIIYDTKEGVQAIGFEMPHEVIKGDLKNYVIKIRDIEADTGLNFMNKLPQEEQDKLELVLPASSELLN